MQKPETDEPFQSFKPPFAPVLNPLRLPEVVNNERSPYELKHGDKLVVRDEAVLASCEWLFGCLGGFSRKGSNYPKPWYLWFLYEESRLWSWVDTW